MRPRFFAVLLVLLGLLIFLLVRGLSGEREALVRNGNLDDRTTMNVVVVRAEPVEYTDVTTRVTYIAEEGQSLVGGDLIAEVYAGGHTDKLLEELAAVREDITEELRGNVIRDILDNALDEYDAEVNSCVDQILSAVRYGNAQQIVLLQRNLDNALEQRQEYLQSITTEDAQLTKLYEDERKIENSISGWVTEHKAPSSGSVSFYLDGWEPILSPDNLDSLTSETIKSVIGKDNPPVTDEARGRQGLYRFVQSSPWYLVFVSSDWNLAQGQDCTVYFENYGDLSVDATVRQVSTDLVQLQVNDDIGELINQRVVGATIGSKTSGLIVPKAAIIQQGSDIGVYVISGEQRVFVPVTVLAGDDEKLVEPKVAGALTENMRVVLQ